MRHQKQGRKLGRNSSHRKAMMRNMVTSLIVHERVTTTDAKAKELRRVAERLVTKAARVSHLAGQSPTRLSQADKARLVAARRVVARHIRSRGVDSDQQDVDVVWKLFEDIGPRFADRPGGYLRITKLPGLRKGDAAPMSIVEFVVGPSVSEGKGKDEKKGAKGGRKGLLGGLLGGRKKKEEPEDVDEDEEEDEE
jgi:large subunit ribosomal protein L17